jgi:hypothetical protein
MPNKRRGRNKAFHFHCPFCQERLWRTGTPKYKIFYQNPVEIRKNTGISAKNARFLVRQNSTYLDNNRWIEGFCCPVDGSLWLLISLKAEKHEYRIASEKDWLQTNATIDPRCSNPSVSEFTLRMSRKPG